MTHNHLLKKLAAWLFTERRVQPKQTMKIKRFAFSNTKICLSSTNGDCLSQKRLRRLHGFKANNPPVLHRCFIRDTRGAFPSSFLLGLGF